MNDYVRFCVGTLRAIGILALTLFVGMLVVDVSWYCGMDLYPHAHKKAAKDRDDFDKIGDDVDRALAMARITGILAALTACSFGVGVSASLVGANVESIASLLRPALPAIHRQRIAS